MMRTYSPKKGEVERLWFVVDASELPLGRVCTEIAKILTGKHKPQYAPHVDTGDFVVVVNAEKAVLSGQKEEAKIYYRSTTRPGSLKSETVRELRQRKPVKMIERAVRGMLPKNRLGRRQIKKLKVYPGSEHPHQAQQPTTLSLTS
jgi:large subunit ribosomal protein L13